MAANHKLLFALAAFSIAAPNAISQAIAAADPPDNAPMETMQLVTDQKPATDTRPETKAESKTDTGAAKQPGDKTDRQPGVKTTTMIEMAPVGQARRAGEAPLFSPPIQTRTPGQPHRDRRVNRFGWRDEAASTPSTHPSRPTFHAGQTIPAHGTIRNNPTDAPAHTMHPVNQLMPTSPSRDSRRLTYSARNDAIRDSINELNGDIYVGFGRNTYVRRPKYEHRHGYGRDLRNIRTNQDYFALPRHGGGQDLFDPRRGRVIHGIKRRDGSVDYYDPNTGRWILTQERRR